MPVMFLVRKKGSMKKRDSQPTPLFQNPEADGSSFEWMTDSNTGVVCLHGFTATTVEVRTFAEELNKMGYCVNGPLLPGHGVSPEEMNKVKWEDWFDAADSAFQSMERQCENIFLAGESTGALLSLLLAIKHPQVKGLLLFAPALKIPGLWMSRLVWPFKQYIYKKNIDLTTPWQGFNVIPLHGASELARLQMKVRRELSGCQHP